jgi:hypothetical protein
MGEESNLHPANAGFAPDVTDFVSSKFFTLYIFNISQTWFLIFELTVRMKLDAHVFRGIFELFRGATS